MTPSRSPVPRLMAFSMVSIGTDESRAFWNIVRRVGFMSGSPPPSRAATSTWRMSLAKSLPRALSAAPFLCLIVAHLEWPDIRYPFGDERSQTAWPTVRSCCQLPKEQLVHPQVGRELRMERGDQDPSLATGDGTAVLDLGED